MCVLGMFRSGTSVVAGIVARLGVHFGAQEEMLAPNRANPSGFWEHRRIIELNDELLARAGGAWHTPPALVAGWESEAVLDDLRDEALALIRSRFSSHPRWGWKDPRTCLTLPFWRSLAPPTAYVICVRRPLEAARSLATLPWAQRHLSRPFDDALDLWLAYTKSALAESLGHPRLIVFYEDVITSWQREVSRLRSLVGDPEGAEWTEIEAGISAFVQPALHHQQGAPSEERALGHPAESLYLRLRSGASFQEAGA